MLKPYRQIEENGQYTVFEFKTIYLYTMYSFVIMLFLGWLTKFKPLEFLGGLSLVLYSLFVSIQYIGLNRKIKRAAKASSVELSGSKWSFSNPLKVKIKKELI